MAILSSSVKKNFLRNNNIIALWRLELYVRVVDSRYITHDCPHVFVANDYINYKGFIEHLFLNQARAAFGRTRLVS